MRHPWWVRAVAQPKYEISPGEYGPFDPRDTVFAAFTAYAGREEAERYREESGRRRAADLDSGTPGYGRPDRALEFGAQAVWQTPAQSTLLSWNSTRPEALASLSGDRRPLEATPERASRMVKKAARFYGAAMGGVARLNRNHLYSHDYQGRSIVFGDVPAPVSGERELVIPETCRWVVALAIAQDSPSIMSAPAVPASAAVALGYSTMPAVAGSLAEFIRAIGYNAIPCGNDTALSVPIAIDAGLGELGRHSRLITPRYGSNVRLAKVITDLPMAEDKPVDFGVMEFCRDCLKCARECPSGAISRDREPSFTTLGPWNRRGVRMWPEDAVKCYEQWYRGTTGCSICVRVCPYNHPDTLVHRAVMAAVSTVRSGPLNRAFVAADDIFGFGRQVPPESW